MMIIAGSGMCTGGRILHHLRHNLWRPEASVIFVGYQAEGSLGREITEGAERVRIFGDTIQVNAQVATINGFSGHAGQSELVQWYDHMAASKPKLILTHGEDGSRRALARCSRSGTALRPFCPTTAKPSKCRCRPRRGIFARIGMRSTRNAHSMCAFESVEQECT